MTSHRRPRLARRIAMLALPSLAVATLAACTASDEKVIGMAAQAQQLLDAGQPFQAQELIRRALAKRDDLPAVYIVGAHVALTFGRRGDAYIAYTNALALEATNPEALIGAAQTGMSSGHIEESDRFADKILVLDPNQPDALLVKGIIRMVRNDHDSALDFANRILAVKPDNIPGLILRSRVLALQGEREKALTLMQGAIARTGETMEMVMSLAELQRGAGDANAFLASLRRIRELAPRNRDYRFDLVDTLYRLGRTDEARTEASSLLDEPITAPDELARFPRLWYAEDTQALTAAQLDHAAKQAPVEARMMLARYLVATGRAAAAVTLLRPIASGWSSDVQGLYARALVEAGQAADGRAAAERLLRTDPDNGDALLVRAQAATARRDPTNAIVDLQRVVRNYPQWEEGYLALANAYAAAGKPDGVRRAFEDGHKALPQNLPLARADVERLLKAGDSGHALDVARRFALDSPSLGAAWALYAQVCAKSDDGECRVEAADGAAQAKRRFGLDLAPGTPPPIALIGRLS